MIELEFRYDSRDSLSSVFNAKNIKLIVDDKEINLVPIREDITEYFDYSWFNRPICKYKCILQEGIILSNEERKAREAVEKAEQSLKAAQAALKAIKGKE